MTDDGTKKKSDVSVIWGGRFAGGPGLEMEEINASINFDKRLYAQDIAASKAHAEMLQSRSIISDDDADAILSGLDSILAEIEAGEFAYNRQLEDIHMNVESRLRELIGDAAGRLHTARSRNDQVATGFRLWVRDALDQLDDALGDAYNVSPIAEDGATPVGPPAVVVVAPRDGGRGALGVTLRLRPLQAAIYRYPFDTRR